MKAVRLIGRGLQFEQPVFPQSRLQFVAWQCAVDFSSLRFTDFTPAGAQFLIAALLQRAAKKPDFLIRSIKMA